MRTLLLLLLSAILNYQASSSSPSNGATSFSFSSFSPESCTNGDLICTGAVTACKGYLSLTSEPSPSLPLDKVGRVLYHLPVVAWPASIVTSFTIKISKYLNTTDSGDGMTFIFAPDSNPSPTFSYGSNLGLSFNEKMLAIELDTYKNDFDLDGNHVAIDTTSIEKPLAVKSLNSTGILLNSGREITFIIQYSSEELLLNVYVQYVGQPLKKILKASMDISEIVPSSVYVGFTAATGAFAESHQLLAWSFKSKPLSKS